LPSFADYKLLKAVQLFFGFWLLVERLNASNCLLENRIELSGGTGTLFELKRNVKKFILLILHDKIYSRYRLFAFCLVANVLLV